MALVLVFVLSHLYVWRDLCHSLGLCCRPRSRAYVCLDFRLRSQRGIFDDEAYARLIAARQIGRCGDSGDDCSECCHVPHEMTLEAYETICH